MTREIRLSDVGVGVLDDGPDGDVVRPILQDVNLTLTEDVVAVIGANGSGKSTLLQMFNGLVTANAGEVLVDGFDPRRQAAKVRSMVGFVFTDPAAQLVMPTPIEDIELSLRKSVPKRERRAAALAVLDELGIADLAERSVYDEPTTLLDLRNKERLRVHLQELVARRGVRIILTTHDLEFAQIAQRAIVVDDGRIVADAAPAEAVAAYRTLIMSDTP